MKILGAILGAALTFSFALTDAKATPITGGSTVLAPLVSLDGFEVDLLGSAQEGLLFPITGGTLDDSLVGQIEHEGSGLRFGRDGNTLSLENFVIDTARGGVFGDVSANGALAADNARLFDFSLGNLTAAEITDLNDPRLGLRITETAIGAFRDVLGVGFGHNTLFANAATAPSFNGGQVSAPGGLAVLLGAFGFMLVNRRRKGVVVAK